VRSADDQYLELMRDVRDRGDARVDRTGVGTKALFGAMCRFDLAGGHVPILTTKRVYWKTAVREMLWFLGGGTNIRPLLDANVHIWSDWPHARYVRESGEAIDLATFEARVRGDDAFAVAWGELGPVYGKQWRRWAGPDGREHDQIATLVRQLRETPASRRLLFHAWNVADLEAMALPPCHMVYQFHVTTAGRLDCLMFQRSADLLLGVPFNWVGTAALQLMLAATVGLTPGELVWMAGDVHLYANHAEAVEVQLARTPRAAPVMRVTARPSIDVYDIDDFTVEGYAPWPAIVVEVAV